MARGGFNDQLGIARSYYAATSRPLDGLVPLAGAVHADLVIVGAGCTGLATAIAAAQRGRSVVVLEGGRVGWGASGRNGGQMIPGLRKGASELVALYGRDHARRLFELAIGAREAVVELIRREAIDCDLRLTGHLTGAIRASDLPGLEREVDCLGEVMGYTQARMLDAAEIGREIAHPYRGGLLDAGGGHLHPLNYTIGLAETAMRGGVRIHEESQALDFVREGRGVTVRTSAGTVHAEHCVLAGDALLGPLDRSISRYILPVANYIAATAPLPEPTALIAHDRAVSDTRFVVNYYRLSADGRLLFGGGERYTTRPPADMPAFVRPFMERAFPALRGFPIDHAWGGLVSVTRTRLPHIGRDGPVLWAHGYSGMGTILSTLAGQLLAAAVHGDDQGLDLFASISPPPFPGGTALRRPLNMLAMLWFAARDRLGF